MADSEIEHVRAALSSHFGIEASEVKLLVDAGSNPNHVVTAASTGQQFLVKALRSRLGAWVAENARQITAIAAHVASNGLPTPGPIPTLAGGAQIISVGDDVEVKITGEQGRVTMSNGHAHKVCSKWYLTEELKMRGGFVAVVEGPADGEMTHFVVLPWAVGYVRADNLLAQSPAFASAVLQQIGSILAKLHSLPLPDGLVLPRPEAPGGHNLCDIGTFMECASDPASLFPGQESEDAKWFRSWLPNMVELWKDVPEPTVLCHGDAYLDNVLAKQGGDAPEDLSLLLIDWEDSCMTNPVADLAACAVGTCFTLSLGGEGSEDVAVEMIKDRLIALVAGYQQQRLIPSAERALLRPMMQACAWACGCFRYGNFVAGDTGLKSRKYRQLIEVTNILSDMGSEFEALAFPG
mmetsp:Transcript_68208/g.118762  ORF Transcript_68208/g.118762 Transcript_68208/m.118762 type:complete len:408 (+) Transcript_68208:47-1270(+)